MLKIPKNTKFAQIAFYAVCTIVISALIIIGIINFSAVSKVIKSFLSVLSPLIYGFVIAYLTEPILSFYERTVFAFKKSKKNRFLLRRALSLILTFITVIAVLSVIAYAVIPSLIKSVNTFGSQLNNYITNLQNFADSTVSKYSGKFFGEKYTSLTKLLAAHDIKFNIKSVLSNSFSIMQGTLNYVVNYSTKIVGEIINILLGIIAAVYFLLNKEKIAAQLKKLFASIFSRKTYLNILRLAAFTHKTFGGFIVGTVIDSIIVGFVSLIVFRIFGIPYYPLLAVIVGVSNIIPTFGPIIGGVVGGFFILVVRPSKLLFLILSIVIIQQIDGNILAPRIIGGTIGLSPMWVMMSIVVAGGLFGFWGMIFGVPATAVAYTLIKQWSERRLLKKNMPYKTEYYSHDPGKEHIPDPDYVFIGKDTPVLTITLENDIYSSEKEKKTAKSSKLKKLFRKKRKDK